MQNYDLPCGYQSIYAKRACADSHSVFRCIHSYDTITVKNRAIDKKDTPKFISLSRFTAALVAIVYNINKSGKWLRSACANVDIPKGNRLLRIAT